MAWRVAKSLDVLLDQVNAAAPNRLKTSDGSIGDAAHATRNSDHNPWVKDNNGVGVVTARDFTHDPGRGCDCEALVASLVASRDPRIKYIIWNRRIINSSNWEWRKYTGANPHTLHAHVSVKNVPQAYDSPINWYIDLGAPRNTPVPKELVLPATLKIGSEGTSVEMLQKKLGIKADGIFGQRTFEAVVKFQKEKGLVPDGIVGAYTWNALFS